MEHVYLMDTWQGRLARRVPSTNSLLHAHTNLVLPCFFFIPIIIILVRTRWEKSIRINNLPEKKSNWSCLFVFCSEAKVPHYTHLNDLFTPDVKLSGYCYGYCYGTILHLKLAWTKFLHSGLLLSKCATLHQLFYPNAFCKSFPPLCTMYLAPLPPSLPLPPFMFCLLAPNLVLF